MIFAILILGTVCLFWFGFIVWFVVNEYAEMAERHRKDIQERKQRLKEREQALREKGLF